MAVKKYLSLDRLTEYDALIKAEIVEGDESVLSSAKSYAKSYTDTEIGKLTSGTTVVPEAEHAELSDKATQLATARTISLEGDATGSVSFDGTKNVSITVEVADDSHNHTIANVDGLQTALNGKADSGHNHDGVYYTETEVDTLLADKSDTSHNHDSVYDAIGSADEALEEAKSYTDTKTTGMATTTVVDNKISAHNTSSAAHSDIRELISALSIKVNNFLDVDDTTTDQLSEVLAMIEANEGTIESLTSNKVNVSDIVDNLTTANAKKVLSANQGVELKKLIDALQEAVDGKAASSHSHTITATATDDDVIVLTGTNGSNKVTFDAKHATSGVTAGSYRTVVVNEYGHVVSGSNPTTLAGYAIENAYTKGETDALVDARQPKLGYTPVQQGGGEGQLNNKIYIGWTGSTLDVQVDNTNVGSILLSDIGKTEILPINKGGTGATTAADVLTNLGLKATASELNVLDGITATTTELNYMDGVTSNVQTQLDNKAASNHTHDVDSALSTTSTNPVQNKVINENIVALTGAISANTTAISANTSSISTLQTEIESWQEITSEEIQGLFAKT